MNTLSTLSKQPFIELVKHRTSCREYKTDPVPHEHIELMLEAVRLAPSACNKQPWRLAVVSDETARMRLVKESFLPGLPMPWAANAPIIIALGVEKSVGVHEIGGRISGVEYPQIDLGIAGEHLVLQAEELGLGTCWIGWMKAKKVRQIVGWPRSIQPLSLITVGWPAGERKTRARSDMSDIVKWI